MATHAVGTAAARARTRLHAACAVLAAAGLITSCGGAGQGVGTSGTRVNALGAKIFPAAQLDRLPAIVGKTLSGTALALSSLTGHGVVVINVWASWCAVCRDESRALAALATNLRDQGVSFVGLNEHDTADAARTFVRSTGTTYPHLVDPEGAVLSKLRMLPSYGIPSTLVVDRRGMMAARIIGATTGPQLQHVIAQVQRES